MSTIICGKNIGRKIGRAWRKRRNEEERIQESQMLTDLFSFSELAREKMWSRIHLIPVLQAEEDRDLVRRHWAEQAREKELMGAETKVYNNDRCVMETPEVLRSRGGPRDANTGTDSCVLHTQSHPARPRNRRGQAEPDIRVQRGKKVML